MQLRFTPEQESFRDRIKGFIAANLPPELSARTQRLGYANDWDGMAWTAILARAGWSVSGWPKEHGGTGWSAMEQFIFQDECQNAWAPMQNWMGVHMVGPIIIKFGSEQLQRRFLEPIRSGQHLWAQGFSEPGAGSDLASLRTRAVRQGDEYIVNGQKIWTSAAFHADWGFFLVRTNPDVKPQAGLSFLLIDLKTPGITIRRIPQLNGDAHLCEVFLEDVRVPVQNLVGEPDQGWTYAKRLLDEERTTSSYVYWNKAELARAWGLARNEKLFEPPMISLPAYQERLLRLEAEVHALEWSVLRVLAEEHFAHPESAIASALKIRGSLLQQAITELQFDLLGTYSLRSYDFQKLEENSTTASAVWPPEIEGRTSAFLYTRAATIFGGTLQVQKNILAKLAFGF